MLQVTSAQNPDADEAGQACLHTPIAREEAGENDQADIHDNKEATGTIEQVNLHEDGEGADTPSGEAVDPTEGSRIESFCALEAVIVHKPFTYENNDEETVPVDFVDEERVYEREFEKTVNDNPKEVNQYGGEEGVSTPDYGDDAEAELDASSHLIYGNDNGEAMSTASPAIYKNDDSQANSAVSDIIYGNDDHDSCHLLGLDTLERRRDHLCLAFAKKLMQSADFRQWFPQRRGDISGRSTRLFGLRTTERKRFEDLTGEEGEEGEEGEGEEET
ncbi:Hypp2390 [Branchiostoma lanceolatum]|uniref:Hypp2390 protein n=1 Tax=Branchiostoma lanceolatum TaxID=7740 RepID=A0A8J9ZQ98_BRALA|nr:Hypp2390 [Branchiostoma lanceolatum]